MLQKGCIDPIPGSIHEEGEEKEEIKEEEENKAEENKEDKDKEQKENEEDKNEKTAEEFLSEKETIGGRRCKYTEKEEHTEHNNIRRSGVRELAGRERDIPTLMNQPFQLNLFTGF